MSKNERREALDKLAQQETKRPITKENNTTGTDSKEETDVSAYITDADTPKKGDGLGIPIPGESEDLSSESK